MIRLPFRPFIFSLLAGTFLSTHAAAQEPSGNVIRVDPAVNATGAGGQRLLELEGAVFMGDDIVASPNGLAQIRFIDDTKMVIGPNSRLRIDEFVFNPDNTAQKVTISAVKGVFRFISGNSAHEAYSLRTPTMTIGVRGTVIDIYAGVNGDESGAIFHDGSGVVCDAGGGNCVVATDDCTLWVVPQGGGAGAAGGVARTQRLAVRFPFIASQGGLDPAFQTDTTACSAGSRPQLTQPPPDNSNDKDRTRPEPNDNDGGYNGG